jgi:glutathione S-transferase
VLLNGYINIQRTSFEESKLLSPILHGFPKSTYVWTARAALSLAGIEHDFISIMPPEHMSASHLTRHPFGKVPTLTNPSLYEAAAIVRWAHEVGDVSFFPVDPIDAARVDGLVSCIGSYAYRAIVSGWLFGFVWAKKERDEAEYEVAQQAIRDVLGVFEAQASGPWLVGDSLTAADLYLGPLLFVLLINDDGKALLTEFPKLQDLLSALQSHDGFMCVSYLNA